MHIPNMVRHGSTVQRYEKKALHRSSSAHIHHIWDRFQFQKLTLNVSIPHFICVPHRLTFISFHFDLLYVASYVPGKIWERMYKSMINHTNTRSTQTQTNLITVVPYINHATFIGVKPFTTWHEFPWSSTQMNPSSHPAQKARTFHSTWCSFQCTKFTVSYGLYAVHNTTTNKNHNYCEMDRFVQLRMVSMNWIWNALHTA